MSAPDEPAVTDDSLVTAAQKAPTVNQFAPVSAGPIPIAFCITELDAGGAERAMVELITRLDRAEWTSEVACLGPRGPLADDLERAGAPVTCFEARSARQAAGVVLQLRTWLQQRQPQLLQTWLYHANIVGRLAGRLAGVPHVVSGIRVAEKRSRWRLRVDRWTSRLVDRHVCVSQAVATFSTHVGGLPEGRVEVIPNGVDWERFALAPPTDLVSVGIPPQSPTVLFVGRLEPQKNPALFIESAGRIARARPEVHFVLAGDGPLRSRLAERISQLGLTSQIHLLGKRQDVPGLMRASTCLVLSSDWEGMPNVVLEGMAAGLPVIATDVEGVQELVTNHATGLIVPPQSIDALAGAILLILQDPKAGRELGAAAQAAVQKHFTWESMAALYARLYRDLIRPKPA